MHPIVVGVDGSAGSQTALRWAVDEAQLHQLPLRVVLIADQAPSTHYYPYTPPHSSETFVLQGPAPAHRTAADFERAMSYARDRLPTEAVSGAHIPGRVVPALLDASRDATMLVVGSRGRSSVAAALLGSVSASIAARALSPVVVVRTPVDQLEAERRIVVGVDGSTDASLGLEFAFAEASARKLPLDIVYCWPDPAEPLPPADEAVERYLPTVAKALQAHREQYTEVTATTKLLRGDPEVRLTDESLGAELVILGSRGRGRLGGLLLGSVSQHLLRYAHCPVAVVRRSVLGDGYRANQH